MNFESLNVLTDDCINLLEKNQLLDALIGSEFVRQNLKNINLDKDVESKIIDDFCEKVGISAKSSISEWCKEKGITEEHFRDVALKNDRERKYCEQEFDKKVEAHFLKRKNQLDTAVYSVIKVKNIFKARELYLRIVDDEERFEDLASKYSEGPEKITLGRIGPVALEGMNPKIRELIRNSKVGETQMPIEIGEGFMILRPEVYTPAKLNDFMRGKMREELFANWVRSNVAELKKELLNKNKPNLNAM